jgi:hypothetical protein
MGIEDIEDVLTLASLHPDILNGGTFFSFFTYHQNTFFLLYKCIRKRGISYLGSKRRVCRRLGPFLPRQLPFFKIFTNVVYSPCIIIYLYNKTSTVSQKKEEKKHPGSKRRQTSFGHCLGPFLSSPASLIPNVDCTSVLRTLEPIYTIEH